MNLKQILVLAFSVLPSFMIAQTDAQPIRHSAELAPLLLMDNGSTSDVHRFNIQTKKTAKQINLETTEPAFAHCVLTESGTLADVLGDKIYEIDSIAVEGPINDADFNTLWDSSFNGHLKIINIKNAIVENGIIPEQALFHKNEQVDWETMNIYTVWLEKLMLPEGVTEIGKFAFAYAMFLTSVNFPTTLKIIGPSAFTDNIRLKTDPLVFPDNLEKIGKQAFYNCYGLTGEVVLPNSLTFIDCGAFCYSKISKINIPQSLEHLGCFAFTNCKLNGAYSLPDNCDLCPEGAQFYNNMYLTEIHLPDNLTYVPEQILDGCSMLKAANVPSKTEEIGEFAYNGTSITHIDFPSTLKTIGQDAFQGCDELETIVLPPSLTNIADRAFACYNLKKIYCMATVPPTFNVGVYGGASPFPYSESTPKYIPVGTKEAYQQASGWNLMTNYIETDNFPTAINGVKAGVPNCKETLYDLMGRKTIHPHSGCTYIRDGKKFIFRK